MRLVVVTGPVNCGKTAFARHLAELALGDGRTVRGVLSVAETENGIKRSYGFLDLSTGNLARYAVRKNDRDGYPRYDFLREGLDFALSVLDGIREADLAIIDEIGRLELAGGGLMGAVERLYVRFTGTLVLVVRESIVSRLLSRLGRLRPVEVSFVRFS